VASIALALEPELYAPKETILGNELRVLVRGVTVKDACIYTRGSVWGIDIILQSKRLRRNGVARALTYAQIFTLNQSRLEELLDHYPMERTRLRVSAIWMALRRGFIQYARDMSAAKDHIEDIARQAEARVRMIVRTSICCWLGGMDQSNIVYRVCSKGQCDTCMHVERQVAEVFVTI
jgi:CRP-like cAMP-binding protein